MLRLGSLSRLIAVYRVVVLPEPVGAASDEGRNHEGAETLAVDFYLEPRSDRMVGLLIGIAHSDESKITGRIDHRYFI